MFDAIKNLNPSHRFQAFLVVIILSTLSSVVTSYLSTDDCSGLAKQYNVLIKNYTETLSLNNDLVSDNNQKQKDFMVIKKILDSIVNIEPEIIKKTTIKNKKEPKIVHDNHVMVKSDTNIVYGYKPEVIENHHTKTIKTETTVTKMGDKQKNLMNNIIGILKKHEKQ